MKHAKLILLFLQLFIAADMAAEDNIMFEKANQLYHNKLYDSAASLYQHMIEDGYQHPALYYNAGNAYYKSEHIGMAVWCFSKALTLDNNKNYRDNLLLSQKKIKDFIAPSDTIFFLRWWKAMYTLMPASRWGLSALFIFLLAITLFTIKIFRPASTLANKAGKPFALLAFVCLFFFCVRYYQDTYHYHGIIIKPETAFVSKSKSLSAQLSEGTEVEYLSRKNNTLLVRLPDGRTGEIPESAFKKL